MVLCNGDPPTKEWLDAPDQGIDPRAQLVIGPIGGDQPNILPLDLTLFLKLNLLTLSCPHRYGQLPLYLTATMHLSVLKHILNYVLSIQKS